MKVKAGNKNRVLSTHQSPDGETEVKIFYCVACQDYHQFWTKGKTVWEFNGDDIKPTFSPSLLMQGGKDDIYCHLYVRDGMIEYLSDCKHSFAGETVRMIPIREIKD